MSRVTRPTPAPNERPVQFADRMGAWYVAKTTQDKRRHTGLFLTPVAVADYMAQRLGSIDEAAHVLDPAAGLGILLCAVVELATTQRDPPRSLTITAYEVDADIIGSLRVVIKYAVIWAKDRGCSLQAKVCNADFILDYAFTLKGGDSPLSVTRMQSAPNYIIANPPYFKLAAVDPRTIAAATVVHGQPNIYGLFMAVGATVLRANGKLVYITPRSFASGPHFRKLRKHFFGLIKPEKIHIFTSRNDAFRRDDVLQENIILCGRKKTAWLNRISKSDAKLSVSHGVSDIQSALSQSVPVAELLAPSDKDMILRLASNASERAIVALVKSWPGSLEEYGLKISTGPVVPFRSSNMLGHNGSGSHVPLLWMNHISPLRISWPLGGRKPEYIKVSADTRLKLVPDKNYVLLRRFSAKEATRRLIAAPYIAQSPGQPGLGLENHLNYIHRPGGKISTYEVWGLSVLFNSQLLDTYFRTQSGNTQVSATELSAIPLPSRSQILLLGRLGARLKDLTMLDQLVDNVVGYAAKFLPGASIDTPMMI